MRQTEQTLKRSQDRAKLKAFMGKSADMIVFVAAVLMFASTFAWGFLTGPAQAVSGAVGLTALHHFVQRVIALLLIVAAWNLRRRKRVAWILCVILLSVSLTLSFMRLHTTPLFTLITLIVKFYALAGLLIAREYYQRPAERTTVRRGARLALIIMVIVIGNVVIGQLWLHLRTNLRLFELHNMLTWLGNALVGNSAANAVPLYSDFIFGVFWSAVAVCLLLILRSATIERIITLEEKEHARSLVNRYGQNPVSYLTLEPDKHLFFGREVEGVVAYGIVGDSVVVLGDPICAPADFILLLSEFRNFCKNVASGCIFISTTDCYIDKYQEFGYQVSKCGEEARFDLATYTMGGGAAMKARQKVSRARRLGVTVREYKPLEQRERDVEAAIARVSHEWLAGKKSGALGFGVGSTDLDDPADRRYFVACDAEGTLCAYNVFLPYTDAGGAGWLVDVTRRLRAAPTGVTELLVAEGFATFKAEGATSASMGLAPLANLLDGAGKGSSDERRLNQVYERFNRFYGFKDLKVAKKKYGPSEWRPQYFVYTGKRLSPQLVYAAIAIQSPAGIKGFLAKRVFGSRPPQAPTTPARFRPLCRARRPGAPPERKERTQK
ncbi:MAG: phosphatidylglycerol lysyltransferase domain-containing protein [Coriobacteriia bacterium]|nr:phosphatidylglycerol lysyltransferase domain-containing protein [Coriobacteriia bacterium]